MKLRLLPMLLSVAVAGCNSLKESPKYAFKNGFYTYEVEDKKVTKERQYVVVGPDTIKVYSLRSLQAEKIDTVKAVSILFPAHKKPMNFKNYEFRKLDLDLDIVTIPLKYRPT